LSFSVYIAKRYIFSRSSNNAINIINRIATSGIIVGTMALFIVLSVFSGLKIFSLSFSNQIDSDLKITCILGKSFHISPNQEIQIKGIKGIVSYSKIAEERVLFAYNGKQLVTHLKGVDSVYPRLSDIQKSLLENSKWLQPNTNQAVIGYGIAYSFSMGVADYNSVLEVMAPKPGKGGIDNPADAFNEATLIPVGVYSVNEDLDSKFVFVDLALAQELLQYQSNQVSSIEIKVANKEDESRIIKDLSAIFKNNITIKNRAQQNETLYKMLNTENLAVYLIFTLVIILALFNWFGSLIMMILDKKENLKTLLNLGAEINELRNIFLLKGTLLSVFGGIIGLFLGILVVLLQQQFEFIMITPTLAYPVVFTLENVLIVLSTIAALGFVASFIASRSVNKPFLD
jgi:lipoprotein-releasing system permease protein